MHNAHNMHICVHMRYNAEVYCLQLYTYTAEIQHLLRCMHKAPSIAAMAMLFYLPSFTPTSSVDDGLTKGSEVAVEVM